MNKSGKSDKLETLRLKAAMLAYFHFYKKFDLVCCEFNRGRADIMAIDEQVIYEVEVKVSVADLRREKEKYKHKRDRMEITVGFPRRFYSFVVPIYLKNEAFTFCKEYFPLAGLYVFNDKELCSYGHPATGIDTKIKAQPLKPHFYGHINFEEFKTSVLHGIGNNLVNAYCDLYDAKKALMPLRLI